MVFLLLVLQRISERSTGMLVCKGDANFIPVFIYDIAYLESSPLGFDPLG